MKGWLFPYGIWYALTAWAALSTVTAATSHRKWHKDLARLIRDAGASS